MNCFIELFRLGKKKIGCRSRTPMRGVALLLSISVLLCSFLLDFPYRQSAPDPLDKSEAGIGNSAQLSLGASQATLLSEIKLKPSVGFFQQVVQKNKIPAAAEHIWFLCAGQGPGITYGTSTLFQENNQQVFLRLDLPPPLPSAISL